MACTQMNHSKNGATSAADLTDDLIVEILSLLPVKSVCRFKCVCRLWYHLISQHRKKLPQTISGFFYPKHRVNNKDGLIAFPTFDGISRDQEQLFPDSSLPFLTGYKQILPKDCCNGLIFCLCWKDSPIGEADYVVCNPATEEWVVLPDAGHESDALAYRLGSDAALSPHFHVFQILEGDEDYGYISGVSIYSSKTGAWSYKENGWGDNEIQIVDMRGVFFNGMMHLLTCEFKILAVDTEGKTWRTISLLESMCMRNFSLGPLAFIGQSQRRLYFINMSDNESSKLSVWILEDYNSNEWIFKYSISTSQLFTEKNLRLQRDYADLMLQRDYALIAIHPECNMLFFVWRCEDVLLSYDMDRGKACVICSLKDHSYHTFPPYLPYVPSFSRIGRPRVEA